MTIDIRGGIYQDERVAKFLDTNTLTLRQNIVAELAKSKPNSIPIILVRGQNANLEMAKFKFLIPSDRIFSDFVLNVRKEITNLNPSESLFFFINEIMPIYHCPMGQLYDRYAAEDGFLYVTCCKENTFGNI